MANLTNVQRKLAEGVSSWLLYEFHCQRGNLFSEKNLVAPVGQILAGLFPGMVHAEVNHPHLTVTRRGRPLQLDFVVINENNWEAVIETKWFTGTPVNISQIIWDLIRLELIDYHTHCPSYFLISGFLKKLHPLLNNTHFGNPTGSSSMITKLHGRGIRLDLRGLPPATKTFINNKLAPFPTITIPEIMHFNIPHAYPLKGVNMTFKTYVWRVQSRRDIRRMTVL